MEPISIVFAIIADGDMVTPGLVEIVDLVRSSKYFKHNLIVSHTSTAHAGYCRNNRLRSDKRSMELIGYERIIRHLITKYLQGVKVLVVLSAEADKPDATVDVLIENEIVQKMFEHTSTIEVGNALVINIDKMIAEYAKQDDAANRANTGS